jgi:hypothetical protein
MFTEALKQLKQNNEKAPVIDPMQSAIMPDFILQLFISFVSYLILNVFNSTNSVKYVAIGQLGLIFFLSPFCLWYWLRARRAQRFKTSADE